jgi:hypothetical protein
VTLNHEKERVGGAIFWLEQGDDMGFAEKEFGS